MKKLFILVMLICMCAISGYAANPADEVVLQINNPMMQVGLEEAEIDPGRGTAPVIQEGRTLVPIRAIIEAFGGTVGWEEETKTVLLSCENDTIRLTIQSNIAYINDTAHTLDVAPQIISGRTMLPIRFVAEGFSLDVAWNADFSCIAIAKGKTASEVEIPDAWKTDGFLKVHFIDVGQGDAVFLELPNRETMLIDAGEKENVVNRYISDLGYNHIHYVIATHPDSDHIGGMAQILNSFSVGAFYMPEKEHTTKTFENMLDAVASNGCKAIYAVAGKTILKTHNFSMTFVSPTKAYKDNNNASAVIWLGYKDNSFLFTGDAEKEAEQDLLASGAQVAADVLKVGHHGSDSSTTEAFLKSVNPQYAVICVGEGNSYGHPTEKTLALLSGNQVEIKRTDMSGTIVFTCDGTAYIVREMKSAEQPHAPPVQAEGTVVYITETGTKYHAEGCSYLKSSIKTTVEAAKSMGLTPCSRCLPAA